MSTELANKPPGRPKRIEDPQAIKRARELYRLHRFKGLSLAESYRSSHHPKGKNKSHHSAMGREIYDWYEEHFKHDIANALDMMGLDEARLAHEVDNRYNSNKLQNVKTLITDDAGVSRVVEHTITVEDNSTRMRATEIHADILGVRRVKGEAGGNTQQVNMIIIKAEAIQIPKGAGE